MIQTIPIVQSRSQERMTTVNRGRNGAVLRIKSLKTKLTTTTIFVISRQLYRAPKWDVRTTYVHVIYKNFSFNFQS